MLKRLELVGFKSFADKTRIDFDRGVTAIVGPNGSGKSNVVDALRWILGEQSAKSLRGKEMADVIYSGGGGRKPLGLAEVSLTIDNHSGFLPVEAGEVVITRRVYRSGEGEYLINGQIGRLKDIKDLFLGTGAGSAAYSIIEQGKIDAMLQASAIDRRLILEEAAGISRFRAKKIETLRRLDRVEQNLTRIGDIKEEIAKQLRSLKSQAGKAQKYRESADRLKLLRLALGRIEFESFARRLDELGLACERAKTRIAELETELAQAASRERALEDSLGAIEDRYAQSAAKLSGIREEITALETEVERDRSRLCELEEELVDLQKRSHEATLAARKLVDELFAIDLEIERESAADAEQPSDESELTLNRHTSPSLEALRQERALIEDKTSDLKAALRRRENEQSALESQLGLLWRERDKLAERSGAIALALQTLRRFAAENVRLESSLRCQYLLAGKSRDLLQGEIDAIGRDRDQALADSVQARKRQSSIAGRIDALEMLVDRHDGFDAGVRHVLAQKAAGEPIWKPVVGVFAEEIRVPAELAELVELALGPLAQAMVVESRKSLTADFIRAARALPARVLFLSLDGAANEPLVVFPEELRWPSFASLIECDDRFRPLVERLFGATFLADSLKAALECARDLGGVTLVTRTGELVRPDGVIACGPRRKNVGVLSRVAELRGLKSQRESAELQLAQMDQIISLLTSELSTRMARREAIDEGLETLRGQLVYVETQHRHLRQQIAAAEREATLAAADVARTASEIALADEQFLINENRLRKIHEELAELFRQASEVDLAIEQALAVEKEIQSFAQSHQIKKAVKDERRQSLVAQRKRIETELPKRKREEQDLRDRTFSARERRDQLNRQLLRAGSRLAELYRELESFAEEDGFDPGILNDLRHRRRELSEVVERKRTALDEERRKAHNAELELTQVRLARENLASRVRDDYGIQLGDGGEVVELPEGVDVDAARREIEDLRSKIAKLGTVNIQAVEQMDEYELRLATLEFQVDDLKAAKRTLLEVIEKTNEESRRLFLDTFETVREHFGELFRRLFGGGKADLVLDPDGDVLESGVDIIARPPGKEPRSISLLSGGEKTMTAVALLLALFRTKPSPFCVLDEVDAALDESNIGRFVESLRDFLKDTQFIIVTHSKTTMASADVLHGVTQREPGVSIRVSVRLEDVSDDGSIIERNEPARARKAA